MYETFFIYCLYYYLKSQGTSKIQAVIVTIFTSFLFITRTLYNILAISIDKMKLPDFGFDWINVSDQADLGLKNII
jgi:integral membrane protein GPR137